jgi:type I restriction-modification system DNA methylase subunit
MSKANFLLNKQVEQLIDEKGSSPERYASEEKALLAKYSGYGGLDQYLEKSHAGILYEFFTPIPIVQKMWGLALHYGFRGGSVLEPAAGNGVFLSQAPARRELEQDAVFTAIEPQEYSHAILQILYPEAKAKRQVFEQLFIDEQKNDSRKGDVEPAYDLIIGNPPYGSLRGGAGGRYMAMGEQKYTKAQAYDEYFILRGLDLLRPGGLLIYIIGSEVANGGIPFLQRKASKVKTAIARRGQLLDAYRLPNGVFERTDVLSDIIVFQKLER